MLNVYEKLYDGLEKEIPEDVLSVVDLKNLKILEEELASEIDPELDLDNQSERFRQVGCYLTILNLAVDRLERDVNFISGTLDSSIRLEGQKTTVKEVEAKVQTNGKYIESSRRFNVVRILRDHVLYLRQLALMRKDLMIEKSINVRADNKAQ